MFFAFSNFLLPVPAGLLTTCAKLRAQGPSVPVNEGMVKSSVVESGCGRAGDGVAKKAATEPRQKTAIGKQPSSVTSQLRHL